MRSRRRVGTAHSSDNTTVLDLLAAFAPHHLPSLVTGFEVGEPLGDESELIILEEHPERQKRRFTGLFLILCLNNGNDPPDFPRIEPCARLECWKEPYIARMPHFATGGGSEHIAEVLECQYRSQLHDVVVNKAVEVHLGDAKGRMTRVRMETGGGMVLMHYNGHGMPRATNYGEIWVFDQKRTSYVPLSLAEVAEHVGSPTLYVFDCNSAGSLLQFWYAEGLHEERPHDLLICACSADCFLPLNPQLPADVLTSCLTTPLRMALEWYINFSHRKHLLPHVTAEMIRNIPGDVSDRKTPLGELHRILTTVTDIVSWCTMPSSLYHRLFRRDETTKVMFRNFLLADRILREVGCVPVTHPAIPTAAHLHHAWDLWDYTLENVMCQLPDLLTPELLVNHNYTYKPSTFYEDQLVSFGVWLKSGDTRKQPEELPSVLSALGWVSCRVLALTLLINYLDSGQAAGKRAILCGIPTYISKLLKGREVFLMVSVLWMQVVRADEKWATSEILHKQLNVFFVHLLSLEEKSIEIVPVRSDQFTALHMEANDECHSNITTACAEKTCNQPKSDEILQPLKTQYYLMEGVDLNRCKSMACYVLCQILRHSDVGGCVGCWNSGLLGAASSLLDSPSAELRSWSCLVLAQLLFSLRFAKNFVSQKCTTHLDMFTHLLQDKSPIVRSSCVTLLSSLVGFCVGETPDEQSIRRLQMEKTLLIKLRGIVYDPSVIVRQELIHFACTVLFHYGGLLPPLQDTDATSRYMDYMQEVGRRFPSWALDEPDVNVKSMLNTSRPTANRCFDSAGVFAKVTQIDHDMCEAPSMPFKESDIPPEGLALLRGMVHDASLMLFTLYQACDKERVTSALGRLSDNGRPQSQRFESEALRSMSRVVSAYSTHFVSEADRACVTRNSDSMQRIVLDLQDHRVETLPPRQSATDRTKPLSAGGDTVIPTVGDDKGNMYASSIHHQVLPSLVPCDQVICATFRALETSMVLATKSQRIYHTSYESYNTQKQIHSFQVHLAAPLHDILVINDASERPGLLLVNQRGGYSLVRDCWGKSSVSPTEVAAFCVCPPLRTVCIKSAYRSHNANLFCGGPIGYGGGTEIHILSLAEEQVIQKLKVSGDPTITSLTTHTTGRAVFAGCSDGVVRYYDDRQKQGFLGAVVALRCRTSPSSGVESVVGAGPVEKDVAALTVAISSHAGVCLYDTRKITAPFLEISAQELRGSRDHASGSESPFICGFDAGTHTGMLGVLFSDGTYTALNVRGRPLLEKPIHVMNAQGTLLPGAFAVHPLRQAMSVGGEILVIH